MPEMIKRHIVQLPSAKVLAVGFSPDGSKCAAGDRDGIIHILDTQNGEVIRKLKQHIEFVYCMTFNPDNGHLITAGKDKSIREWDIETGKFLLDYAGIFFATGGGRSGGHGLKSATRSHTMTIISIATAEGKLMATGGQDNKVKLWRDGEPIRTFDWHSGPVTAVRFQPETNILFSASRDKTVRSWSEFNGSVIHRYSGHLSEIIGMEFIDKQYFVTVDVNGQVILWDVDIESPAAMLYQANARIQCATLSHDKRLLLLGHEDGKIEIIDISWDEDIPETSPVVYSCHEHESSVRCIRTSADGHVASSDNSGKVILWQIQ